MKYYISFITSIIFISASTIIYGQTNIDSIQGMMTIGKGIVLQGETIHDSGTISVNSSTDQKKVTLNGAINTTTNIGGIINLFNGNIRRTIAINSNNPDEDARLILYDNNEITKLQFNTNHDNGDSRIVTDDLELTGGSDLAELFDVSNDPIDIIPGRLVSIDIDNPGRLEITSTAYDTKIAGIISGANGIKPGIIMGQANTIAHGNEKITLSGRAYVSANTSNGIINVGDLITSSDIPGEAMRATNKRKSEGAIIGKAMTTLQDGTGHILVLVVSQ